MLNIRVICLIIALVAFFCGAVGVPAWKINWTPLGLFFLTLAEFVH